MWSKVFGHTAVELTSILFKEGKYQSFVARLEWGAARRTRNLILFNHHEALD